jgi:FKBP-type peptidyl-prolyl cis-trans isomerase FkpA
MKIRVTILYVIILLVFQFCSGNRKANMTESDIHETEEALIGANRLLVQKDREKIVSYIRQHNLALKETASGLWYGIVRQGSGARVQENMLVKLNYKVSLLDGTICYDSDSLGVKQFRVGKGGVESGLEEGALFLNEGSKAILIMPPHLAHGLPGDGNRVPARSIIVYEVELLKVEP